jgi:hypothetical protein
MDQIWIYVIVAIIYGISALLKKKNPDTPESPQPRDFDQPRTGAGSERQLTFEELLREITEGKSVGRQEVKTPANKPVQTYVDYDDDIEEEESKESQVIAYDRRNDDRVVAAYEEAKKMAFERPSLEDTLKLADTKMSFGKFKEFEIAKDRDLIQQYLIDFNDPAGLKRAVVMSEILKPKF